MVVSCKMMRGGWSSIGVKSRLANKGITIEGMSANEDTSKDG